MKKEFIILLLILIIGYFFPIQKNNNKKIQCPYVGTINEFNLAGLDDYIYVLSYEFTSKEEVERAKAYLEREQ